MPFMSSDFDAAPDENHICFVVMPFTDPDNYSKGHFKMIYTDIFVPAIIRAGYIPVRCDEVINNKPIPTNMFEHLDNDPLVLCDLSSFNPNVMYERGTRHFQKKPTVLVQEEGQSYIFDLQAQGYPITSYRKECKYREVLEDRNRILNAILGISPVHASPKTGAYSANISAYRALRTEYYRDWPFKKTRYDFQIEPPSETMLSSFSCQTLTSLVLQAPDIRKRISTNRDNATLDFARFFLRELEDAFHNYIIYSNADDTLCKESQRLQSVLINYILSFGE